MLAKNKAAHIALGNLFSSDQPLRKYLGLVRGTLIEPTFEINFRIGGHAVKAGLMRVDKDNGKVAKTKITRLENFTRAGHQIRVHLSHVDLPLVGDELYGGKKLWLSRLKSNYRLKPGREERPLLARVALHSEEISLPHPITGAPLTIAAPLPKDLKVALKYLRLYAN